MAREIKGLKGAWEYDQELTRKGAKTAKPKTYEAKFRGKKVRVTVPESAPVESLIDMVKEHLSPQAVAAIIAYLQPAKTKDAKINREIEWFSEKLVEAVGGNAAFSQLCEEVGL